MGPKMSYRKPEVRKVKLVPEEAVLTFCKSQKTGTARLKPLRCSSSGSCPNSTYGT